MAVILEQVKSRTHQCKDAASGLLNIIESNPDCYYYFDVEDVVYAKHRLEDVLRLIYECKNRERNEEEA